jgi:hypothetical protein
LSPGKLSAARHDTTSGSQQAHQVLRVRLSKHEGKTASVLGGITVSDNGSFCRETACGTFRCTGALLPD